MAQQKKGAKWLGHPLRECIRVKGGRKKSFVLETDRSATDRDGVQELTIYY